MSQRKPGNIVIVLITFGYVIATLPITYALLIVVVSCLGCSILRENEDKILYMFGLLGQLINKARPLSGSSSGFRSEVLSFCASLDQYPKYMEALVKRKKQLFFMLTASQRNAAIGNLKRLKEIERLTSENAKFLQDVKAYAMEKYHLSSSEILTAKGSGYTGVELIEHFVRDWSSDVDSIETRKELYSMFLPWLKGKKRILVPGSGVGGLAAELAALNPKSTVDAAELSVSMYVGAEYAMAKSDSQHTVYPFLTQFSHWRHGTDQLEPAPLSFNTTGQPSFKYENFLAIDKSNQYDAIATLFFIDTAQNVFEYIDKISELVKDGGIWCNRGPLKWGTAAFAELSVDELIAYIESSGWKIKEFSDDSSNRYNGSEKSMLNTRYQLASWVAVKSSKKIKN